MCQIDSIEVAPIPTATAATTIPQRLLQCKQKQKTKQYLGKKYPHTNTCQVVKCEV